MAFFDWKDEYSVGIQEIDMQHKKLVAMLNALHESLKTGTGREVYGKVLDELVTYTRTHFAAEERLMKTHGYPDYISHKEKHEKMAVKVQEYLEKNKTADAKSFFDFNEFLKEWLRKHILGTDMKYRAYLNEKGVV